MGHWDLSMFQTFPVATGIPLHQVCARKEAPSRFTLIFFESSLRSLEKSLQVDANFLYTCGPQGFYFLLQAHPHWAMNNFTWILPDSVYQHLSQVSKCWCPFSLCRCLFFFRFQVRCCLVNSAFSWVQVLWICIFSRFFFLSCKCGDSTLSRFLLLKQKIFLTAA